MITICDTTLYYSINAVRDYRVLRSRICIRV